MTDYVLSTPQLAVICALSSGATTIQAAEQAGIHRNTIATWRRNVLPFQYALADAQYDRALLYREKAEALADLAIQTIQAILTDPSASAATRLKAALAILQTASTPPEPKKQIILEIQKVKVVDPQPPTSDPIPHATAQNLPNSAQPEIAVDPPSCAAAHSSDPIPDATPQNLPNSAQPEIAVDPSSSAAHAPDPEIVHNSAQSPQPIRRDTSKIGRNDPCPCGSGAKYKRCCLRKPVQPLAAAA